MTVPILFNAGAYGTYLEWCLTSLCSPEDLIMPFTQTGSSHNFEGNHLLNMQGWREYLKKGTPKQFVRLHPKTTKDELISNSLDEIFQSVDKIIFCYPDAESVLLNMNNWIFKILEDPWIEIWSNPVEFCVDKEELYSSWPITPGTSIENIDPWIRREFLSFYLMPAWQSQVEWYFPDQWRSSNCLYVFTKDLLHDFENTLTDIVDFLQLEIRQPISSLLLYHEQNIKLQKHINQDSICNQIIESTLKDNFITWNRLPLPSEAWIQWQLRELGYEIRCHGLDIFPTNNVQLKELLYKP